MKKIVSGKLYNTATAERLGHWETIDDGIYGVEETLYRTKNGAYFLHGEGGGSTKYGVHHGNSADPGEEIIPLSEAEAKEWREEYLSGDKYIEIWGEPEEA